MAAKTTSSSACKQCTKPFNMGESSISCEGFCGNTYHFECVDYSFDDLVCYRRLKNVWWICEECRTVMKEMGSNRPTSDTNNEIAPRPPLPSRHPLHTCVKVGQLDKEIATLREQISEIHRTLADVSSIQTTRDAEKVDEPLAHSSVLSSSQLMCGTKSTDKPTFSSIDFCSPGEKHWLFFTRIKNSVTEREMLDIAINCLGTDNVVVRRLVPIWRDASSMPFISFKVGIGVQFKEVAQRPATWSVGLYFREFRENVWQPPQYE